MSDHAAHPPILVLGIGNILIQDEGVGVRVVQAMAHLRLPDHVEVVDGATGGLDLLNLICGRSKVIVIDAARCDAEPGTVIRFEIDDLGPPAAAPVSIHEFGLLDVLRAAKTLGCPPKEVVVFGISPRNLGTGLDLSPQVAAAIPGTIEAVLAELASS